MHTRVYGRIYRDVWYTGSPFMCLPESAQLLYFKMVSSPFIDALGVMKWYPEDLARQSEDATPSRIVESAARLTADGYIVLDADEREALVRSYMRNAAVITNTRVSTAMARHFETIRSARIRGVIVFELQRLAVDKGTKNWGPLVDILSEPALDPARLHTMFDIPLDIPDHFS